ncbi:MAG: 3'-5' exonuclease [Proteobacteria bacterium]|nr:3'-5' exonuclease [Pseudomonadota bacterium]
MSLFGWLLGSRVRLSPEQRRRLDAWRALDEPDLGAGRLPRYVMVDVESSGLDVFGDRLIAIGAIAIVDARIDYADGFYSVLRQDKTSSDANILVHGIGGTEQIAGDDPCEVLLDFIDYVGKAPLAGFHSQFDEIMISKAMRRYLGTAFKRSWLDLAWLAPAIEQDRARKARSLDDWMSVFGIVNISRHHAFADALATGQLFQVLQHRAMLQGLRSPADLVEAAASQRLLANQRR